VKMGKRPKRRRKNPLLKDMHISVVREFDVLTTQIIHSQGRTGGEKRKGADRKDHLEKRGGPSILGEPEREKKMDGIGTPKSPYGRGKEESCANWGGTECGETKMPKTKGGEFGSRTKGENFTPLKKNQDQNDKKKDHHITDT